jgi:hypothetical protein
MRIAHVLAAVCAAMLAACGGGGGGDDTPAPSTGRLVAGNPQGVHFDSGSQTGTTDAQGAFTYLPGETVTFSIGGVRMGAAPGAAQISLFTLAGVTPPTTELELRRELDRVTRMGTKMARAMNLARLLIALDVDNDPDNGIDLGGRGSQLAGKEIDLGLPVHLFANRLDRLAPDLTRNIPMWRPLTFLYGAVQITVPVHSPIEYEQTFGGNLAVTTTVSYFPNGLKSGDVSRPNLVVIGLGETSSSFTYDALGRPTLARQQVNSPFDVASVYRTITAYDARGNRASEISEQEVMVGVVSRRTVYSGTADSRGLFPEQTSTDDTNGDGAIDARTTVQRTYDARGNPVTTVTTSDTNGDGRPDSISRYTDTFDADDHLQLEVYEDDSNADGTVDARTVTTYQPNTNNIVEWKVETDYGNDGTIDERQYNRVSYDAAGNQVSWDGHGDHGTDDSTHSRERFVMTYDGDRRLLSRVSTHDFEDDGVIDRTYRTTYSYDTNGGLVQVDSQTDPAPFSVARQLVDYAYGAQGERTSWRSRIDFEGDGVYESDSSTQITSQEFADGVLMLGYQYFEGGEPAFFGGGYVVTN